MHLNLRTIFFLIALFAIFGFTSCGQQKDSEDGETQIILSDDGITVAVNGKTVSIGSDSGVQTDADIVYYQSGQDSSYGEGTEADAHDSAEADAHTVVTITKPGTYRISGTLSKGQLAVDLGDGAKKDPAAVVTLILDGADITCTVAPAVIFYRIYECGDDSQENASGIVDTSAAGANVIIADGSVNHINGSYVAKIYKEGTTDKLHKYDGAFYSRRSMNISGEDEGTGELYISAENEGLDSELHLTINGGKIYIESQDDGINTNEDFVSVTTINGGYLFINAGLGSEGDGIDSNGYLTINGGTVITLANGKSGDGGLDADRDILLNGGTVIATGSRNDTASQDSQQPFIQLSFASTKAAGELFRIEDSNGTELVTFSPQRDYQTVTYTSPQLTWNQTYHIYSGGKILDSAAKDGLYPVGGEYTGGVLQQYIGNSFGMMRPGDMMQPGAGKNNHPPEGEASPDMMPPEGTPEGSGAASGGGERPEPPEGGKEPGNMEFPENGQPPEIPEGGQPPEDFQEFPGGRSGGDGGGKDPGEGFTEFLLTEEIHSFSGISEGIAPS